ncbi:helix-turn-helix domain-containing protein [Tardiphaga sp. 813_E8_N1_3]|uniref:helix-turn-helix domain-containing protein n=1 Tax=Tardiphaga sp. 813_E8_N1_3 TaxID=3240760 RepID=UPI003F241822
MSQPHTDSDSESVYTIPFAKRSFSVAQTAAILSVSESTVFELLKSQRLRSFKVGRARRVSGAAIDSFRSEV